MKKLFSTFAFLLMLFILSAQTTEQYYVSCPTLNLRKGPGTNYEVIFTMSQGDMVKFIEKHQNGWWLVDYNGSEGYVFPKYLGLDTDSGWEQLNYQSGDTPECENIIPEYNFNIDNYLRINVGTHTEVVLKLMKMENYSSLCIRVVYIRKGETYEIKNIPEGKYFLKIAYGKDYRQKKIDNTCYMKFMKDAEYEKGTDILDYNLQRHPDKQIGNQIRESWTVPSFELSLDVIGTDMHNTFESKNINEEEFNK
jgi:hypothetical protein